MILLTNLDNRFKTKGKSIGASHLSLDKNGVSVLSYSPPIYNVQKCFMSSGSRKPPVIRYSNQRKNRYHNTKNLTNKKRIYKKTQDSENSHIKNIRKTIPRLHTINPYKNSNTKKTLNKSMESETITSLKNDTKNIPIIDKKHLIVNIDNEPNDSLTSVFAKTLKPTIIENDTQSSTNNTISSEVTKAFRDKILVSKIDSTLKKDNTLGFAENFNKIYSKEFYQEKIREFFIFENDKKWTVEKQDYLKTISEMLNSFYIENKEKYQKNTRDIEELNKIKDLYSNYSEKWLNKLLINLSQESIKSCRTISNYEKEIERYTEMISILNVNYTLLPDPVFHEIVRRLGVIINNDAIYKDVFGNSIIVKEGEGSTLTREVYASVLKNKKVYFIENEIKIDKEDFNNVFATINSGDFFVGHFKQNFLLSTKNKFIESGDERHMHLFIKIQKISKENILEIFCLSLGFFTSNKDDGAIKLTSKQYMNGDHNLVNKEQWFRPFNQLLHLKKDNFIEIEKATNYAKNTNCENINVQEKLITEIMKKKEELKDNAIREVFYVTKENIKRLAIETGIIYLDNLKKDLEKLRLKLQNLTEKERIKLENERENQYKKTVKNKEEVAFYSEAPFEIKKLNDIKILLEKQRKNGNV